MCASEASEASEGVSRKVCLTGAVVAVVAAFTFVLFDRTIMWTRLGATCVAPVAGALTVLTTAVVVDSVASAPTKEQTKQSRHQSRLSVCCATRVSLGLGAGALLIVFCVFLSRLWGPEHLDDLSAAVRCDYLQEYARRNPSRTQFLWLIPLHHGVPLASNATLVAQVLHLRSLGRFELGMHGVRHQAHGDGTREFETLSAAEVRLRLDEGVEAWRTAFNETPRFFSFPGQWASRSAVSIAAEEYGMHVRSILDGVTGRVFHCDDSWCNSPLCQNEFNAVF